MNTKTTLTFNREDYSGDSACVEYRFRDLSDRPEFKAHIVDVFCDDLKLTMISCVDGDSHGWGLWYDGSCVAEACQEKGRWYAHGSDIVRDDESPIIALLQVALNIL